MRNSSQCLLLWGICFSRPPAPIKFVSAVFYFLPVCVVKCSCAALVKYNFEYSIHKYLNRHQKTTDSTTSTSSGQIDITSGLMSTTNGQMGTTSGQTNTTSGQTSTMSGYTSNKSIKSGQASTTSDKTVSEIKITMCQVLFNVRV